MSLLHTACCFVFCLILFTIHRTLSLESYGMYTRTTPFPSPHVELRWISLFNQPVKRLTQIDVRDENTGFHRCDVE